MTVQVTTLGGAAAWPNPGQGCSSYLVRAGDTLVLLDCGPDTLHVLRAQIDLARLSGIVISHFHADHTIDLVPLRYALVYGPLDVQEKIPLWLPPGGDDFLARVGIAFGAGDENPEEFWTPVFDIRIYEPGNDFSLGGTTIATTTTQHFVDCHAIRVTTSDGRRVVYSADTGSIQPLLPFSADADLLICEATVLDHGDTPLDQRGHLSPQDAAELATRARVRSLVLTHLWSERPDDDVLRAAAGYSGPVHIAKPGATFDVS